MEPTRERILLAAMQLFAEKGYGSTSVQDILKSAQANAGSLYHFFPTKQDVLLATLEMYRDGIVPMLPRFRARHPDIVLSLVISNEIANLSRREADIAIRFVRPQRGDLVTKRVFEGPYALFAAPGVAARPHADLELVGWDESYEHLPESRWEHASGLRVAARATTVSARVAMAIAGVGAVALPRAFAALLEMPTSRMPRSLARWVSAPSEAPKCARE